MVKRQLSNAPVGIIYAGGTFGSYGHPLRTLAPSDFLPLLSQILTEHFASYPTPVTWQIIDNAIVKDSSQLTPKDFASFYKTIVTAMQAGIRQFVLLTGTDTLTYLAAFLAESFAHSDTCIIVTGAMQPLLQPLAADFLVNSDSDATQNLYDACKLARHGDAGVRICFAGEHWPAQTVQKIHSQDLMAFVGHHRAGYPANSYSNKVLPNQRAQWLADKTEQLPQIMARLRQAQIASLYLTPMSTEQLANTLAAILTTKPDALIILGFGAGNVPDNDVVQQQLKLAKKQGCLVAITTQCTYGGVTEQYEAGAWLSACGVLPTRRLTMPAIYARLLWLIANYETPTRRRQRWTHCLKDTHSVA